MSLLWYGDINNLIIYIIFTLHSYCFPPLDTLSYMPTCILMLGVFAAYFITIVIFAGLYLTVNKVGVYYDHSDTTHGGETTELMTEDLALGSGTSGVDEPSFCGMDINNHMEGEFCL